MKLKKLTLILLIAVASVSLMFADTNITADETTMIDVRSLGMGGTHVVDTTDFYTILKNPAGLALTGKKGMISVISVNVGGPLAEAAEILNDVSTGSTQPEDILSEALARLKKINVSVALDGPLCFGAINNNGFGWAFMENVNVDANVPSLTQAKLTAMLDMGLIMGYGFKFDFGAGTSISVGVSAEGFAQIPRIALQDSVANIVQKVQDYENLPCTAVFGLSCDAGVQARLFNFIDAAIVWEDFFSPYVTKNATVGEVMDDPSILLSDFGDVQFQSQTGFGNYTNIGTFKVGAGINLLPNGALGGLISGLKIQADIKDFGLFFRHFIDKELGALERSPWCNFNAGVEVGLMSFIYARAGYSDGFLSLGASIKIGALNFDAAVYSKELGLTPGSNSQLNAAFTLGLHY